MIKEIKELQKIEDEKLKIINKIKGIIKTKRGDLHDWEFYSVHHGWTFWYSCKLCEKENGKNRKLTREAKKEKCPFFNNTTLDTLGIDKLENYLKYWRE